MKRVLIWGMTANWGGIESVLYNYVTNSKYDEIRFDFITPFKRVPRSDKLEKLGCKIVYIPDRRSNYLKYRKELTTFFKKHSYEYDALWLNDCMFANIDALKLAKKYGIKKRIIHAHNSAHLGGGVSRVIRHKINSLLLPLYATDYWACSELAGKWSFSNRIRNSHNYLILNNAIDTDKYKYDLYKRKKKRKELGITQDKFVIGHVGRFDYQKNPEYLLKIMLELKKDRKYMLLSIGVGSDWEIIKNKAKEFGMDNILFLGQREDVDELFQAMDCFVLPSQFEGLPVVLIEAMAAGLPCVISDKVTQEVAIVSDLAKFESINGNVKAWINDIKESENIIRRDTSSEICDAGFDIKKQANKFHQLF